MFYNGVPVSGNVSIDGLKATLSVTNTMDRSLDRDPAKLKEVFPDITLVGHEDDTMTFKDSANPDPNPVELKRAATPR